MKDTIVYIAIKDVRKGDEIAKASLVLQEAKDKQTEWRDKGESSSILILPLGGELDLSVKDTIPITMSVSLDVSSEKALKFFLDVDGNRERLKTGGE